MSHTTNLSNDWIAIHDGTPSYNSEIIFRRIDKDGFAVGIDIEIPYCVVRDFVAEQIRQSKISMLESMPRSDILALD